MRFYFAIGIIFGVLLLSVLGCWLGYARERTRGAQSWEATMKDLRDRGEPLAYRDLIPPEVPEAQNFASLPFFRTVPDPNHPGTLRTVGQTEALEKFLWKKELPRGNWIKGSAVDPEALTAYVAEGYRASFPEVKNPPGLLEQFDALCPAMNELRVEAETRPFCRFARDYTTVPYTNRPLGPATAMIKLVQVLNLHALTALQSGRPDLAMGDLKTGLKIVEAMHREPNLISGLVAIGGNAIQFGALWTGLKSHAWTDPQLAGLQRDLQKLDFLCDTRLCFRGEGLEFPDLIDFLKAHRDGFDFQDGLLTPNKFNPWEQIKSAAVPLGWFDLCKAQGVSLYFEAARKVVDPAKRRFDPGASQEMNQKVEEIDSANPFDLMLKTAAAPIFKSASKFAEAQSRVDQAIIVCGLERYRLAQGVYPDRLDDLKPYLPSGVPQDPMTGGAYHYQRQDEGTFSLYSVGWNLTDEGGRIEYQAEGPKAPDREHGDWVWPSAK